MVSENDVLEAGLCRWCVCVGNFQLKLPVWTATTVNQSQSTVSVSFVKVFVQLHT